ncbi:unnamed protein product [Phytophthora fragariaefolia]|uniref:Unnamed protein product n=1 Tax=Phytophthora fragariaefolia TaxID=1490495 RepID=A0A9W7DC02_9STRA|nr:unnamed protein product [Phytophthora fragariaefolia]
MLAFDDLLQAAHVVSMRASIARLEEQTSQWRATSLKNERLLQAAQRARAGHNQDRDSIARDRDSVARDRDSIARDRDSIARNRDSLMQDRDALAQVREVIVSDYLRLQEQYSNAYRRMRAIAAAMGQDVHLPVPSSFATYSPASSATAGRAHKSQLTPLCRTSLEREETEDDGTDDEDLSALSRSRSSLRRRGSLTPRHRTLQPIIDVDGDGDSSSGSSSGNTGNEWSGYGGVGSSPQDHVGDDPAVGDLAGATLEVDEIDDSPLFPTFVPRRLWIPGVSIDPASHPLPDYYEDLITGATVDALMDTSPWSKLSNGETPLTFIPVVSGRRLPPNFVQDYLELEERHLQSYWESTHFLPISEAMCSTNPALSTYHEQRRQRRSRAGAAWRRILTNNVIPALRHRQCDLDILLDPFFLHFPKSRVTKYWFSTLDGGASSLAEGADILDLEKPWRPVPTESPRSSRYAHQSSS